MGFGGGTWTHTIKANGRSHRKPIPDKGHIKPSMVRILFSGTNRIKVSFQMRRKNATLIRTNRLIRNASVAIFCYRVYGEYDWKSLDYGRP